MGSACTCYLSYRPLDLAKQEITQKPFNSILKGKSQFEEPFIQFNLSFHNSNFSSVIRKSRSKSAFSLLKVPNDDRITIYKKTPKPINEIIITEGELEKYKPNLSSLYTPRWCRLSNLSFSYYKNKWSALYTPLYSVPLSLISKIKVIENRIQKNNPEMFEFEIILHSEEDNYSRKSKATSRECSIGTGILDEEVLIGSKKLVFGTKDVLVFQFWMKSFNDYVR